MGLRGMLVDADALRGSGQAVVLGIQILDMGVFLGIILGCVSAMCIIVSSIQNLTMHSRFMGAQDLYLSF